MKMMIIGVLGFATLASAIPNPDLGIGKLEQIPTAKGLSSEEITNLQNDLEAAQDVVSKIIPSDKAGQNCVQMVKMDVKVEYDENLDCIHTFQEKCHNTYITDYIPTQEERCEDSFEKNCHITYRPKVFEETIKVCREQLEKECSDAFVDASEPKICSDYYETICKTSYKNHTVEEEFPDCKTEITKMCVKYEGDNENADFKTENGVAIADPDDSEAGAILARNGKDAKCLEYEDWPIQKCGVVKKLNTRLTPDTKCEKIRRELCDYSNCKYVKKEPVCGNEVTSQIQRIPEEECQLDPVQHCSMETVLVPSLVEKPNCVKIPQEICKTVRTNPKLVKKPTIKNWCYKKEDLENEATAKVLRQILAKSKIQA